MVINLDQFLLMDKLFTIHHIIILIRKHMNQIRRVEQLNLNVVKMMNNQTDLNNYHLENRKRLIKKVDGFDNYLYVFNNNINILFFLKFFFI